jgi:type IV pilus assembly protein PilW
MNSSATRLSARGFTLVEMMVAMTLSLVLLGGVLSVLYSSKVTYNENERTARMQENMRASVEVIARDLRGGGFPGCSRPIKLDEDYLSVLANPTSFYWNFLRPVEGFDATDTAWSPALPAPLNTLDILLGNDVLVIRTVRSNSRGYRLNTSMTASNSQLVVKKLAGEKKPLANIPMLISDCQKSTIFAATTVTGADSSTTATIAHAQTSSGSPRNTTANIGVYKADGLAGATVVTPIDTIAYFVAPGSAKKADGSSRGPSLWRISATEPTPNGTDAPPPVEVVEGVEAMQIRYGIDTDNDMFVDTYLKANAVTDWTEVRSVNIAVVVRSAEEVNPEIQQAQVFDLLGTNWTSPADRRTRALFTTTIALRNRTI